MSNPGPKCLIIAGPNGAGKTTLAKELLSRDATNPNYVNVDFIASGLAPFRPESAAVAAGRLFLKELDRLVLTRASFAFETTLSGLGHLSRVRRWRKLGYHVELIFIRLDSSALAVRRVATRVKQGGHHVSRKDILRRCERGLRNLPAYCALVDAWSLYDNSGKKPVWLEQGP
jgi:predicted ABC-type ATPase